MSRRLPAPLVAALLVLVAPVPIAVPATALAAPAAAQPAAQPAARPAAQPEAEAAAEPSYQPPADAPVIDPFRPPESRYGAGNRGIDLDTRPGDDVWASADGDVVFAGPVAGSLHVVVAHADGLRTSYSFLGSVAVAVGDRVEGGDRIGVAGGSTHFGVRAGDAYLDPEALFDEPLRVWLVPHDAVTRAEDAARRRVIDRLFDQPGVLEVVERGVAWARRTTATAAAAVRDDLHEVGTAVAAELDALEQELRTYGHYLYELDPAVHVGRALHAAHRWRQHRDECTPGDVGPPQPSGRRIVVLVAGLNSSSTEGAVDDVDTAALGYDDGDVVRFSYAGGDAPYGPEHTRQDIRTSAALLVELLRGIRVRHPGVPVDVVAHSQGGLVARAAMDDLDPLDRRNPDIGHLVTLGTPHHGADAATAAGQIARSGTGELVLNGVDTAAGLGLSPDETSIRQMSETSDFIADLNGQPPPAHVEITSIAARADVVVAAPRSHLAGATNVIVGVDGLTAHDRLPGSAEALREVALALAGLAPTCEGLGTWMRDHLVSDSIGTVEDGIGLGLSVAARFDGRLPRTQRPPVRTH